MPLKRAFIRPYPRRPGRFPPFCPLRGGGRPVRAQKNRRANQAVLAKLPGGLLATELGVELLDATGGVHEALFAGIGGVRVHGDFATDDEIFDAIDQLGLLRLHGRTSRELAVRGDIHEDDVVIFRMACLLHKIMGFAGD